MPNTSIRLECLRAASDGWEPPTGEEIRCVIKAGGFTGAQAAMALGLGTLGDRTVRRWIKGDSSIPYAAWALLCDFGQQGQIWKSKSKLF